MKYILLMSGTRAGVEGYHAWPKKDIDAHMAVLHRRVRRSGEKNGLPVTDGIFPESKEFLLGYWIVDVANAARAYAIAGRISAASLNMPIEVRQFATHEAKSQ